MCSSFGGCCNDGAASAASVADDDDDDDGDVARLPVLPLIFAPIVVFPSGCPCLPLGGLGNVLNAIYQSTAICLLLCATTERVM